MEKHDDCKKAKDQDSLTENDSNLQLHLADLLAVISPIIVEIRVHLLFLLSVDIVILSSLLLEIQISRIQEVKCSLYLLEPQELH